VVYRTEGFGNKSSRSIQRSSLQQPFIHPHHISHQFSSENKNKKEFRMDIGVIVTSHEMTIAIAFLRHFRNFNAMAKKSLLF
jgi:hypothetical protein